MRSNPGRWPASGPSCWAGRWRWTGPTASRSRHRIRTHRTWRSPSCPPMRPKTALNRIHLDLASRSLDHQGLQIDRAFALGARRVDIGQGAVPWTVLADPEGNEFCVLEPREEYVDTGAVAAIVMDTRDPLRLAEFWSAASRLAAHPPEFALRRYSRGHRAGPVAGVPAEAGRIDQMRPTPSGSGHLPRRRSDRGGSPAAGRGRGHRVRCGRATGQRPGGGAGRPGNQRILSITSNCRLNAADPARFPAADRAVGTRAGTSGPRRVRSDGARAAIGRPRCRSADRG